MSNFSVPPVDFPFETVDILTNTSSMNAVWRKWFIDLSAVLNSVGAGGGGISHNATTGLQGGTAGQYYHLTAAQLSELVTGIATALHYHTTGISLALTGDITTGTGTLHKTSVALTNGAAAAGGTLTNAPAAGNPTKWVPINDNGTTRYIPCW